MSEPFIGSIIIFAGNFAPRGWALCNGQLLAISQNQALFSILGTTYGGDGVQTFALPNLQSRVPIHPGQGPGLSPYIEGQTGGVESVTLTSNQMPSHTHSQPASNAEESTNRPAGAFPAKGGVYATAGDGVSALAPTSGAGGNQAHENRQPFLAVNYIIALQGIFPSRN